MKYPFKTQIFRNEVVLRTLRDESMDLIGIECIIRNMDHVEYVGVGKDIHEAFKEALDNYKELHEHMDN